MSETDDTDELLLIPPDFFVSNPALDNFGPYYKVVDSLITQVTELEDRINLIESSSEISLISDFSDMHSPSRVRKYTDENKMCSTQSTPQKPRTKYTLNSLPTSPIERLKKSPVKRNIPKKIEVNPMLGEIDNFLSNVKYIKRMNSVRNLENDFNSLGVARNLDINQVNEMLKEVELQEKKNLEKPCLKENLWKTGDNVNSLPNYGFGMRKEMYPESQMHDTSFEKAESESSSESTQTTAYDKFKFTNKVDADNLGMVSLAKLWNSSDGRDLPSKFQQKLQEERLRRQHCEKAIQDLQNRVLELQERVAVAIEVDEAKDKAIMRFHDSWEKAGLRLKEIERQKEVLEEEVEKLRKKMNEDSDETNQKIAHYEKEASLALNIAHSTQDKLAALEKKTQQLESDLKTAEINSEEFQKKYLAELEKNRQYPDILAQKDLELNDCKSVLVEAKKEVSQSKKAVEVCQTELLSMKNENEILHENLQAEKENNKKLIDQKNKCLEEISAHKNVAKGLQEELTKAREQIENNKIELKNFYQGQVELVVQTKLKEFQQQLDDAERALKDELSKKELSMAKTAASHIQQISEKHALEIKLLEEKHQEQCRLYQLQIAQLRHELDESNQKIKRQHDKHIHIEKQLHKFMESLKQDHFNSIDEINSFRSKSFNNLEEILSFNMAEEERNRKAELDDTQCSIKETPVANKSERNRRKEGSMSSFQETIQMLLLDRRNQGEGKNYDEGQHQVSKENAQLYQKMKDGRGKPPWK